MCKCILYSAEGFLELGGHLLHFVERCGWQESRLKTSDVGCHLTVNECSMRSQCEKPRVHHQQIWSWGERFLFEDGRFF